jgi:Fe-S-cluster containining protein
VERIGRATGQRRERFVEEEPFGPEEIRAYEALRPAWTGYFDRAPVRWGLRAERGACVFLGSEGCTLSPEVRPTACLLYPFEPGERTWTLAVERSGSVAEARASGEPRCLAVEEAQGRGALLRAFGVDVQALTRLRERLRAEVRAHPDLRAPVKGGSVR